MHLSTRRQHLSLLAACGGFGTTDSSTKDDMQLKVVINTLSTSNLPLYIAIDKGYLKDQGVTISPLPLAMLPAQAQITAAIASGSYELCAGGVATDLLTLTRISASIKLIAELQQAYGADVTVSNKLANQAGLSESSGLQERVKALVGKTVGVVSTTGGTHAMMEYLFRSLNLGDVDKQVTFLSLGGNIAGAVAALKSGRVDALSFPPPSGQISETQGIGHVWISPAKGDIPAIVGQLNGVCYASQNIINGKPKTLKGFIRAIATGQALIQQKPGEATAILQKYLKLDEKTTQAVSSVMLAAYPATPRISQQAYNIAGKFHVTAGIITAVPQYSSLVETHLMDDALNGFTPKI